MAMTEQKQDFELYDTFELLDRAYKSFIMDRSKVAVTIPIVENENKKCYVRNFYEMAASINRKPEDLQAYFQKEIGYSTSITGNKHLKFEKYIRDRTLIARHFKDYIKEYVICKSCKSIKTNEIKENRIKFLVCTNCKCRVAIK